MNQKLTYKNSGVDIDAADDFVSRVKTYADKTKRTEVLSGIGHYAGLFSLNSDRYKNPVLVATTDGVGTKLKLALQCDHIKDIGQDLVAMCVNDLICCGAEPLFFLDYFATGKLDVKQATTLIESVAEQLKAINCTLLGGETAEMPGLYQGRDFDIAGFAVGVVEKNSIVDGSHVGIGNKIIGLASSGFHSNGFSLIRKIIDSRSLDLSQKPSFGNKPLGLELLTPTIIYVQPVLKILKQFDCPALAHITGGGIVENLPRVLPKSCQALIEKNKIKTPTLFRFFQEMGHVPEAEMWRVFNMGIGFIMIVKAQDEEAILDQLKALNVEAASIGVIEKKSKQENSVLLI